MSDFLLNQLMECCLYLQLAALLFPVEELHSDYS